MLPRKEGALHAPAPRTRRAARARAGKEPSPSFHGELRTRMGKRTSSRVYIETPPRRAALPGVARLAARLRESIRRIESAAALISERERALERALQRVEALLEGRLETVAAPAEPSVRPRKLLLSPRLLEVYGIVKERKVVTPNELSRLIRLRPNTCSEYLKELVYRGYVQRVAHGMYAAAEESEWEPVVKSQRPSRGRTTKKKTD